MKKPHTVRRCNAARAITSRPITANAIVARAIASWVVLFVLLWGCASSAAQTQNAPQTPQANAGPARHLVFIGLDGWGGAYVEKANMPTAKRMMADGASSLNMRCIMPSISWPNWSTLFFGATPEQRTGGSQKDPPENPVDDFPSVFSVVKSNTQPGQPLPALFYEWSSLEKLSTPETADIIRIGSNRESAEKAAAYIKEKKPLFLAIAFDQPDITGHRDRWGSAAYYDKLAELDSYIAIIEQAVKDAGIYDTTTFILSGDHGGSFNGHGYPFPSHRKIPFIAYGYGIKQGYTLPSPLSICDIAPTMTAILGIQAPAEWTGRPLYEIFK
jgi:predicted AlkP superfamily pyrophosphatase or phosphodiesterase